MVDIEKIKAAALAAKANSRDLTTFPSDVLELIDRLEASERERIAMKAEWEKAYEIAMLAEKDAAKWQAYQKRKQEVIAAGMGRKIMRDLDPYDALPAFYAAMKEKP